MAVGAVQVAMAVVLEVVRLIFVGQLLKTGGVASASQGFDKIQEPIVGLIKLKPKPPRCPLDRVKKPLPPNISVFCPLAPTPT